MLRTHTCGEISLKEDKKNVQVAGWVQTRRDHGGLIFIDLRDRYGITQLVFDPSHNKDVHQKAEHIGREWVLIANGVVRPRPADMVNKKLKTGEIEVLVDELVSVNKADVPPFEIDDEKEAGEDLRLQYRYLDLRRPKMQERLITRHKAAQEARAYLSEKDFLEIETPLLIRSTPEGARDYVVPSRVNPGKFYALPQSPQIYKQILMISGFDRYYQIARCLRDEDLRQDRQPEHTQIDIEMSFAEQEDIRALLEGLAKHLQKTITGKAGKDAFPILTYQEAMERYGSDKPDLRFGMELIDATEIVQKSDFKVFKEAPQVKCIVVEKDFSRNEVDELIEWSKEHGAKGLAWMKVSEKLESSIVKFFSEEIQKEILTTTKAKKGSYLFFVADKPKVVAFVLGELRNEMGQRLGLAKPNEFKFCWVVDFPLFEWKEDENKWDFGHNPFAQPKAEDMTLLDSDPGSVRGELYDLVLNGIELGSGAIRISEPSLQEKVFGIVGIDQKQAKERFGFLLEAYKYGAPTHGGFGWGLDRTVALLMGFNDIREVIAFPKNKKAECPMDGSPSEIDNKQLKELHIKTDI